MFKRHIPAPIEGQKVNNLPVSVAITVPSTKGAREVTDREFDKRVEDTRKQLSDWFGGDTTVSAGGGWVDDDGNLIDEQVAVVEAFTSIETYKDKRDEFGQFVKDKHEEWGQSQLAYRVEDRLFLYPHRDWADDGRLVPKDIIRVH